MKTLWYFQFIHLQAHIHTRTHSWAEPKRPALEQLQATTKKRERSDKYLKMPNLSVNNSARVAEVRGFSEFLTITYRYLFRLTLNHCPWDRKYKRLPRLKNGFIYRLVLRGMPWREGVQLKVLCWLMLVCLILFFAFIFHFIIFLLWFYALLVLRVTRISGNVRYTHWRTKKIRLMLNKWKISKFTFYCGASEIVEAHMLTYIHKHVCVSL